MSFNKGTPKGNNIDDKVKEKNPKMESFDKVYNIQKLILKHAGLKELCKKKFCYNFFYSYSRKR